MIDEHVLFIILGMSAVTFLPRWLPLFFLSGRKLPQWFEKWLEMIPVSLLSAILLPSLILTKQPRMINICSKELMVAIPTFLIAYISRSLAGTVIGGMLLFWLSGKL